MNIIKKYSDFTVIRKVGIFNIIFAEISRTYIPPHTGTQLSVRKQQ